MVMISNELPCNPLSNKPEERNVGIIVFFRDTQSVGSAVSASRSSFEEEGCWTHCMSLMASRSMMWAGGLVSSARCGARASTANKATSNQSQSTCTTIEQAVQQLRFNIAEKHVGCVVSLYMDGEV